MAQYYSVSDFVTLVSGQKVMAKSTPEQQRNIYLWLKKQGFGQALLNKRNIFFQIKDGALLPSSVIAMRYAFLQFLESEAFINWPEGVSRHDLLEWFYNTSPPKRNEAFKASLFTELTGEQIHQYKMADDACYRHRWHIDQLVSQLNKWGFRKRIDEKSTFSKNAELYYKQIEKGQYLIFNHFNKELAGSADGFDCWLVPFRSESEIGRVMKPEAKDIRLSFQLDRDIELVSKYF
ncbi:hypothetical protein [Mucilaginibacter psychrotolerans]|uniref:Uncharacterized protein n=1 Tax=Mucilaginibacter psychrotolerans TaxID=1524096 RepID=A0A4Y8SFR1_9SPHI|nr:hypothetical protein [Mucilaginibacter psychrotolerans]TFF37748.1 hypothetical protein E2R66_11310 [Mucilaginibacter psychrotolerans]